MSRRIPSLLTLGLLALAALMNLDSVRAHDRPGSPPHKSRSAVLARHGMAATSQPLATAAAVEILRKGGNAVDAAIAANAVLGVVEPMSCGMGGDLFAIVWDAKSRKLYGLNASGRAPYAANREFFASKQMTQIPTSGPLSWSVPGCVDGWATLRDRFGTMPLAEILQPAIGYAEEGFPVSEVISGYFRSAAPSLARVPTSAATYLHDGAPPEFSEIFRNPDLAASLRVVAKGGRDAYYKGPIAEAIVAYSKEQGGLFRARDFAEHSSTWVDPVSTNYRGYDVWQLPPNGQGIAVLQMLNLLEHFDLKSMGPQSADALHLMIEAKKLAYEDRARFYADPEFAKVPIAGLISKEYAAERVKLINPNKANPRPTFGEPPGSDTVYLCVADGAGNAVSFIQSNYNGFGSGHVPGRLGFALQNRGCLFSLDPKHPNTLEPHKRPFHTIIPGFVTKDGKPWFCYGVMGGDQQPQGQVQVLCNLIDWGMDVQSAGDAPRFSHVGSSTPTGIAQEPDGGTVFLESEIRPEVVESLTSRGHVIGRTRGGYGGYQGIRIDPDRGVLMGGSEPRFDGCAFGY